MKDEVIICQESTRSKLYCQISYFKIEELTSHLKTAGAMISWDSRVPAIDNIFMDHLCFWFKYEEAFI